MATEIMGKTMKVQAKPNHPTHVKLDKLITFLRDELKLEMSFYSDRIFIKNMEVPNEKDWEVVNVDGEFVNELPTTKYRLTRDVEHNYKQPKLICGMIPKDMKHEVINSKG